LVRYCRRCTAVVAIGTCCSSTLSNPTMEGSSERRGKMDSCLISSFSTAPMPKAHRYPLGSLKYPLLRQSISRMHGASWPVTMGCFCQSCPVRLTSASNTLSSWDPPVTPEIQMDSALVNLMALKDTVHQCPLELYTLVDLTCQTTESTPSNKCDCPFPSPGWRQGPYNSGQRICCSLAVRMTWRSLPQDRNQDLTVYLVWRAGCRKLERHFS